MSWLRQSWRRLQAGPKFDLPYILSRANPDALLSERVEFCENLVDWIRYTGGGKTTPNARIRFLLQLLERKPEWRAASSKTLLSILRDGSPYHLFYEAGIPHGGTFLREVCTRVAHVLIPSQGDSPELGTILGRIFYDERDGEWVEAIPPELWREILDDWLLVETLHLPEVERALADAALALSVQCAAIALRTDIAIRSPEFGLEAHPFLHLEASLAALSAQFRRDSSVRDANEIRECHRSVLREIGRARNQMGSVKLHIEEFGLGVDLVYQIDRIKCCLERIDFLASTLESALVDRAELRIRSVAFFRHLVTGLRYDSDLSFVCKDALRILAMKIVDRVGFSREAGFTSNWKEWRHLFSVAGGGGVLIAFTTLLKSFGPGGPPFLAFLYSAFNFSISFTVIYLLGLKLAMKQPPMISAALAGRLVDSEFPAGTTGESAEFTEEVARFSRAQFAALLGNLVFIVPTAFILNLMWRGLHQTSIYSADNAAAAIEAVSPLHAGVFVFAALTGIILWISSLGAGTAENFLVTIRAGEILSGSRFLKRVLGADRARRLGHSLVRNVAGIKGAFLLGFLLAGTPLLAEYFGIFLDVRHVTLTAGTLAFSFFSLGDFDGVWVSLLSVLLIGFLNFAVSFTLAMMTALRARNANLRRTFELCRDIRRAFFSRPWIFFFPPKDVS
jgi:site-specific recombinase